MLCFLMIEELKELFYQTRFFEVKKNISRYISKTNE